MVQATTCNEGLGEDAAPVLLRRRETEEFPEVETEIVRGEAEPSGQRRSARFSLFHWFRRGLQDGQTGARPRERPRDSFRYEAELGSLPNDLSRVVYSSSASVDTNCSTATSHSFDFRPGDAEESSPSRRRSARGGPRNCSSVDNRASTYDNVRFHGELGAGDGKQCAGGKEIGDSPGRGHLSSPDVTCNYRSLPSLGKTADVSEYKRVHVRGKRRAPNPPRPASSFDVPESGPSPVPGSSRCKSPAGHSTRRKRRAPPPPGSETSIEEPAKLRGSRPCDASDEVAARAKRELPGMPSEGIGVVAADLRVISNDTLKLEGGFLLPSNTTGPNMHTRIIEKTADRKSTVIEALDAARTLSKASAPLGQVAPRPWYKRSSTTLSDHDLGSFKRDVLKIPTLSKPKENRNSRLGPEVVKVASPQEAPMTDRAFGRLNFFGRGLEKREDRRKEEKRKSGLSILTNISELDREAAAIVQAEQARTQALLSQSSACSDPGQPSSGEIISEIVASQMEPRRSTRALISKFNAISNITKVTVNSAFFARSAGPTKEDQSPKTDRIVTKRLLCDGEERVNEMGELSSINFFRQLEAQALESETASATAAPRSAAPAADRRAQHQQRDASWEEKIKRYFPEIEARSRPVKREQKTNGERYPTPVNGQSSKSGENNRHEIRKPVPVSQKEPTETLSRAELKEMLKEMKHSLPKRPKPKHATTAAPATSGATQRAHREPSSRIVDPSTPGQSRITERSPRAEAKKAFEVATPDKVKVSSAAQTSANLRKVESRDKEPRDKAPSQVKTGCRVEDTIYTTNSRKTGPKLTRNTFQLIRPRDFACIEALKTEKNGAKEGQNTYMNVLDDSLYANSVICSPKKSNLNNEINEINAERPRIERARVDLDKILQPGPSLKLTAELEPKRETKKSEEPPKITRAVEELPPTNMNTFAINRLLRKLEGAIASGQHQQAAGLAKELAQLKIHCSVVRQRSHTNEKPSEIVSVDLYIEDKLAHQGPIPLQLSMNTTVAQLKAKVFAEFEIPINVQRWIIGKNLADNDNFTLDELKAEDGSSIFLYLVAPDLQIDDSARVEIKPVAKEEVLVDKQPQQLPPVEEARALPERVEPSVEELKLKRYEDLMSLENSDVIPNSVPIECPICFAAYGPNEGVILRDCLHMFCRTCIGNTIMYCDDAEVKCPFRDLDYSCESTLQEREIKALVTPEIYEQHLTKSMMQAENNAGNNAFHCKTPDCPGWCIYDDNVNVFSCPVCGANNCLTCQAIHTNKNCREYQDEIRLLKETDQETKRTAAVLEEMVESGEALACPTCAVVLMKKWGCDWLRCSMCKTEICWVTRGPRWGPGGKGDTSGGCKCGENGVKCHPRCNYCH